MILMCTNDPYKSVTDSCRAACTGIVRLTNPVRLALLLVTLAALSMPPAIAEPARQSDELHQDAEAIKSEAIELINRLRQLEHQLLYPAHTRLSVFVSVTENSTLEPRSIRLVLDDETVTRHRYSDREANALRSGGIQRLFTGNTTAGKHRLNVSFDALRKDGSTSTYQAEYRFNKDSNAATIEIVVGSDKTGKQAVTIRSRS